jgi:hypothetical protein
MLRTKWRPWLKRALLDKEYYCFLEIFNVKEVFDERSGRYKYPCGGAGHHR